MTQATSDQASAERLLGKRDDRDDGCRPFGLKSIGILDRKDHVHLEPNELSQECSGGFRTSIFPAKLDQNIAIFDPAEFAQPAEKRNGKVRPAAGAKKADGRQLSSLLRPRRQWPYGCSAAEPCNKFAPSHLGSPP